MVRPNCHHLRERHKWNQMKSVDLENEGRSQEGEQEQLCRATAAIARVLLQMHNKKMFDLDMKVRVSDHNIRNGAIR